MKHWHYSLRVKQPVVMVLVIILLMMTFVPTQYHVHDLFDRQSIAATQAAHLHTFADQADDTHEHFFSAIPDTLMKVIQALLIPALLLSFFLMSLFTLKGKNRYSRHSHSIFPQKTYPHFSPPLRAPPRD